MTKRILLLTGVLSLLIVIGGILLFFSISSGKGQKGFDGERALQDVVLQVNLGPRIPGSDAHSQFIKWLTSDLENSGWKVEIQNTEMLGHPIQNIIAKWGQGSQILVLGAHYDSRLVADKDPTKNNQPVPGANDGASGVAVLSELARIIPSQLQGKENNGQIWLVFFDAEDNGKLPGWDWLLGSKAFVQSLQEKPKSAVIVDMIGDADLNIYQEKNSDPEMTKEIWEYAAEAGYSKQFIPIPKYRLIDDHTPFLEAGIPAVDIIDFDYPYYHTASDTTDKVSAKSLKAVGDTLMKWLSSNYFQGS